MRAMQSTIASGMSAASLYFRFILQLSAVRQSVEKILRRPLFVSFGLSCIPRTVQARVRGSEKVEINIDTVSEGFDNEIID